MRNLCLILTIAAISTASTATASEEPRGLTAQQMEIYRVRQELRVEELRLRAELKTVSSLDVAKIYADRLEKLREYDQELELRYIDTLKSPETPFLIMIALPL
jgi:hypothetical protein